MRRNKRGAIFHYLKPVLGALTLCGRKPGRLYCTDNPVRVTCLACVRASKNI